MLSFIAGFVGFFVILYGGAAVVGIIAGIYDGIRGRRT